MFPLKRSGIGIKTVCKECKEKRKQKKQEKRKQLRRERIVKHRAQKERITNPVFVAFSVTESFLSKINLHVQNHGYISKAQFFRKSLDDQLNRESIFCNEVPKPKTVPCGFTISGQMLKEIQCSTARSDYSGFSDFVRVSIRKRFKGDEKLWQ